MDYQNHDLTWYSENKIYLEVADSFFGEYMNLGGEDLVTLETKYNPEIQIPIT